MSLAHVVEEPAERDEDRVDCAEDAEGLRVAVADGAGGTSHGR
jgi:hypothetical protein